MHPKYRGWFAFRSALIFKTVLAPQLACTLPEDCMLTQEMRLKVFESFNCHWRDWAYTETSYKELLHKSTPKNRRYTAQEG